VEVRGELQHQQLRCTKAARIAPRTNDCVNARLLLKQLAMLCSTVLLDWLQFQGNWKEAFASLQTVARVLKCRTLHALSPCSLFALLSIEPYVHVYAERLCYLVLLPLLLPLLRSLMIFLATSCKPSASHSFTSDNRALLSGLMFACFIVL
jgi:hypothetical protein